LLAPETGIGRRRPGRSPPGRRQLAHVPRGKPTSRTGVRVPCSFTGGPTSISAWCRAARGAGPRRST